MVQRGHSFVIVDEVDSILIDEARTPLIISGKGEYDDDGVKRTVSAGDMTFTPDGHGHGLKCLGDEPVVFMALIIFD